MTGGRATAGDELSIDPVGSVHQVAPQTIAPQTLKQRLVAADLLAIGLGIVLAFCWQELVRPVGVQRPQLALAFVTFPVWPVALSLNTYWYNHNKEFENVVGQARPWLGFELVDRHGGAAFGARVEVVRRGGPTLWRRAHADGSFGASSDPRVLVGLGDHPEVTAVRVHWPGGAVESWPPPAVGRYHRLVEGRAPAPAPVDPAARED